MLKSMTGFGYSVLETNDYSIKTEIRTLNSKALDMKIKLPPRFYDREIDLQGYLEKKIERGKTDVFIQLSFKNVNQLKKNFNADLFKAYYNEIAAECSQLGIDPGIIAPSILNISDVINTNSNKEEDLDATWQDILSSVEEAVTSLNNFRLREGLEMETVLKEYLAKISEKLAIIDTDKDKRIEYIKEKLKLKLSAIENARLDENRLEQELIYYIEKFDISEEIDRLKAHIQHFISSMEEENSGRKLGFISQELGREINTIGSKANEYGIQKLVVEMKDELEKIKQQLANIL